jgi:hypothetical protein
MRMPMMRTALIATTFATAVAALLRPEVAIGQSGNGPWCAVTDRGGNAFWDCSVPSLEACQQEVIAGNRGFCNPNPRWQGPPQARRSRHRRPEY